MTMLTEERALGIVFGNTRTRTRAENLLTVAEALEYLVGLYGTQKAVAVKVGLSQEIVMEFRLLLKLPDEVQELVRSRRIDQLETAYRIAMVKDPAKQIDMAREIAGLKTEDVRDVQHAISRDGLSAKQSRKAVLNLKLKGLHVFALDFDDEQYGAIIELARTKKLDPAEMLKSVVLRWTSRNTGGRLGKSRG